MKRVEDVLGKGWENHVEGQKLKADGDSFRMKLSTQEIFDDWARKVQQRNLGVSGRIFAIDSQGWMQFNRHWFFCPRMCPKYQVMFEYLGHA